jgi:hypothetical protein
MNYDLCSRIFRSLSDDIGNESQAPLHHLHTPIKDIHEEGKRRNVNDMCACDTISPSTLVTANHCEDYLCFVNAISTVSYHGPNHDTLSDLSARETRQS